MGGSALGRDAPAAERGGSALERGARLGGKRVKKLVECSIIRRCVIHKPR